MTIIDEIISKRREDIKSGIFPDFFIPPTSREVPIVLFGTDPFIIAEVKKKSPSKGIFTDNFNHMEIASSYIKQGIRNISVITEKNYFAGSLSFLYEIKKKYPEIALLRKDFLVCENDIEVSYNCGADALLLIASALDKNLLEKLYMMTVDKGMKALVEIHDEDDLEKIRSFKPSLIGINSRDLRDFSIDMLAPLALKSKIDWETELVFESGIGSRSDAFYAFLSGFKGILTGESVIKNRGLASVYKDAFYSVRDEKRNPDNYFWNMISKSERKSPLVKICGITNRKDCIAAADAGADMIGMVFAPSVREADISLPELLFDIEIPKVAVVVNPDNSLMQILTSYYNKGLIDAIQFSGDEDASFISSLEIPFYKTLRVSDKKGYEGFENYHSVRVLVDSYSKGSYGGSGKKVSDSLLSDIKEKAKEKLWLAGGISLENAAEIIDEYSPELLDASSSLEVKPGIKDHDKMERFIHIVKGTTR